MFSEKTKLCSGCGTELYGSTFSYLFNPKKMNSSKKSWSNMDGVNLRINSSSWVVVVQSLSCL